MTNLLVPCLASTLAIAVAAQRTVVVPAGFDQIDAPTLAEVAGFNQRFRQQLLIRAGVLAPLSGLGLSEAAFRRDGQHGGVLSGGATDLVVTVSETTRDPSRAARDFNGNHGANPAVVFAGRVSIPNSPALSHRNAATWQAPDVVRVPFAQLWPYGSAHVCLEVVGTPVAGATSRFWPVDAALYTTNAAATPVGTACDPRLRVAASRASLVPGGTVRFLSAAPPGSPAAVMIGLPPQLPGIDLGFLNAPGCKLLVYPATAVGVVHTNPVRGSYGDATLRLTLPGTTSLLGGALGAQLLNYGNPSTPSSIATSAALWLQLAASAPPYDVVQVRSGPLAAGVTRAEGEVIATVVPVMQLTAR